jgi:hypothetical protein
MGGGDGVEGLKGGEGRGWRVVLSEATLFTRSTHRSGGEGGNNLATLKIVNEGENGSKKNKIRKNRGNLQLK